ncbi:hypothetical protein ElyMa_002453200 [Elysia marginata]|uniref:Uncharacterized protein n=1 Tax=Elysia marginata TaxID=1093978 RepID=A0AAV4GLM1_9GAST|nr:hypothetical protein ElyMa_002453200 [Elysia marginata]
MSGYYSCSAHSTTSVSPTPSLPSSHIIESPGDTADRTTSTSSTAIPVQFTTRVMKQEPREQFSKVIDETLERCPQLAALRHVGILSAMQSTRLPSTPSGKGQTNTKDGFKAKIDLVDPAIVAKSTAPLE